MRWIRAKDERGGIAVISSVLLSTVMTILGVTSIKASNHALDGARVDRKRVLSFHGAEAGIDKALVTLQTTHYASLPCADPMTGSLDSNPGTITFSVAFDYYPAYPPAGAKMACPLSSPPGAVLVRSLGDTDDSIVGARKIEVSAQLTPTAGGGFKKAIFSNQSIDFDNSLTLSGYQGSDAVAYTNGDYNCDNSQTLMGFVYAQGNVTQSNSCQVGVDVWANGSVTLQNNIQVGRDAISSTSSVTLQNAVTVGRNVVAGTTVTLGNNPSIGGQVIQNNIQPAPPYESMPQIPYDEASWISKGYTIRSYGSDCDTAVSDLKTQSQNWTAPTVVRTTGCSMLFTNTTNINMKNNIVVVADRLIEFRNQVNIQSTNASETRTLYLMVPWGSSCASPNAADIHMRNSITIHDPVLTFIYSPCQVSLGNNQQMLGQVYAGKVLIRNSTNIAYRPIGAIPGYVTSTDGREIAIAYKRELAA